MILGVLTDATADLAVTLLLATARRTAEAMRAVKVSRERRKDRTASVD